MRSLQERLQSSMPLSVALGVACALGAFLLRQSLNPILGLNNPFTLFYPVVMLVAWYGGTVAGIACIGILSIGSTFFLLAPSVSLAIQNVQDVIGLGLFDLITLLIVFLVDGRRKAAKQLEDELSLRRKTESALRESQERYQTTLRSIGDAVVATDRKGNVSFMNPVAEELTGWKLQDAQGLSIEKIFHIINEFDRKEVESPVRKVLEHGKVVGLANHTVLITKDGRQIPIDDSSAPIWDDAGELEGVVLVFRGIAERRKAEEIQRRHSLLVESSDDAIIAKSLDGTITSWNSGAARLFGYQADEAIGKSILLIYPPDRRNELGEILQKVRSGDRIVHHETVRIRKDGSQVVVSVSISPIQDIAGNTIGISSIKRDITERKRQEDAIKRLNEELEQRVEDRTRELLASNKELEAFSYSVSHDLRAPLRAISGFSGLLRESAVGKLDDEALSYIQKIGDSAVMMGRLVDELLSFSRLNRQEVKMQEIDMRYLFKSVAKDLLASEPGRTLSLQIPDQLPSAKGDELLIRQVIANLLSNAFKFTRHCSNPIIEISCVRGAGEMTYSIKDNGTGFDMQYADKLFGVFQRLHLQEEYEGTGIGLALVKRIVERHGGRVWAEGKPNQGATFSFALPA